MLTFTTFHCIWLFFFPDKVSSQCAHKPSWWGPVLLFMYSKGKLLSLGVEVLTERRGREKSKHPLDLLWPLQRAVTGVVSQNIYTTSELIVSHSEHQYGIYVTFLFFLINRVMKYCSLPATVCGGHRSSTPLSSSWPGSAENRSHLHASEISPEHFHLPRFIYQFK